MTDSQSPQPLIESKAEISEDLGPKAEEMIQDDLDAEILLKGLENGAEDLDESVIDQYLKAKDPNFIREMSEIEKDKALHALEVEALDFEAWEQEKEKWIEIGGLWKRLALLSPIFPKLAIGIRISKFQLIKQFTAYRVRAINFIFFLRKEGLPRVLQASQDSIQQVLEVLSTPLKALGLLKLKQKVLALASVLLLAGSGYFLWLSLIKQKVLIKDPPLFWARFSDLGDEIPLKQEQVGDLQEFSMSFYDNSLVQRYQFLVEKLVINLEPSDFSSRLPMVAMELILESFDPLVLARIKAKESFFREIIQAETASFSFEIIESAEGKKELLRRIREALNRQLGERAIVAVYFKTIVVKP